MALKASEKLRTALAGRLDRLKPLLEANSETLTKLVDFCGSLKTGEIWLESSDRKLSKIGGVLWELNTNMESI